MGLLRRTACAGILATAAALVPPLTTAPADAAVATRACAPSARAVGYSDALDKLRRGGHEVGGLSDLAWDARSSSYASTVDRNNAAPARLWFFRTPLDPTLSRGSLVLRRGNGVPWTGADSDYEGLVVLPDGRFAVSSEDVPVIRVFGRDGVQTGALRVPDRFRVAPAGQATDNATLEGLTITPDGSRLIASMEGGLSGDAPTAAGARPAYRRLLIWRPTSHDGWVLTKEVGYHVATGNRIAEVQAYGDGRLLVLEADYDATHGNTAELYGVQRLGSARDVTGVSNLSAAPASDVVRKTLIADVSACPTLGASSPEAQTNPLMDNYEGMAIRPVRTGSGLSRVMLISDDNLSATQKTRVLTLAAHLF
jgi:hypothetical protein